MERRKRYREGDWVTPMIERVQEWPAHAHIPIAAVFLFGCHYIRMSGGKLVYVALCFVLGLVFLFFALMQFTKEWRMMRHVENFMKGGGGYRLYEMEYLMVALFHLIGYKARPANPSLSHQGVDVVANKKTEHLFIQFNHYNEPCLTLHHVETLFRAALADHAKGVIVTFGEISPEAYEYARLKEIVLFDRAGLEAFITSNLYEAGGKK
jgi:HJR/Mrr/RecB family endonuclease